MNAPMDDVRPQGQPAPHRIVADEAWDWVDEVEAQAAIDVSNQRVTAVLVTHNAGAWLPQTLQSLRALEPAPERFIAVDTGSHDDSLDQLRDSKLFSIGVVAEDRDTFGRAIGKAIEALVEAHPSRAEIGDDEWLWLLHDDITVAPDALRHLLECAVTHPDADIIGPKLLQPGRGDGPRRIAELGVTISDTARRHSDLEPGEIDQQQHASTETLGLSTCGMLVRRRVFETLDGLAPELPVFRDGVEFGWRANRAGHRVRTCPGAVIVHRQAGRSGLRRSRLIGTDPEVTDRVLGMRTVAAHRGSLASARLVWGCLLRALGFLLAKRPDRSRAELKALGRFFDSGPTRSLRDRLPASAGEEAAARVRDLRPPWWSSFAVAVDAIAGAVSDRWQQSFGHDADTSIDELTGDEFAAVADRPHRSALSNPLIIALIVLTASALIAARGLIRPGHLSSDVLLPARSTLGAAYQAYLAPVIGAPGIDPPPWLGWTALGSTLTFGQPDWFVSILLLAGAPLTLLTATMFLRRVVRDARVRIAAATLYALVPPLLGAVNRGLLEVAVVALLLPLLGLAVRALVRGDTDGPESWRSAWSTGLLLAIILAFAPVLSGLVFLATLAGLVFLRRDRARLARLAVAIAVPVVLLLPWLPALVRSWSRVLVGPDAGLRGLAASDSWTLLLGRTAGDGLPWLWLGAAFFGLLWALALLAAFIRPASPALWAGWGVALVAFAFAALLGGRLATVLPQGTRVRPDVEALLLVTFAGLILAAAVGFGPVAQALMRRGFGVAHIGTALVALATVVALLAGIVWWVVAGAAGPVRRTEVAELPPFIRNAMQSDARTRTLVLEFDPAATAATEAPRWSLVADDQNRLGDADRGLAFAGSGSMQQRTSSMVARLVSGAGDERVAEDLASLAVSHVWARGATEEQRSRINNTPGLGAEAVLGETVVWAVDGTTGRYLITGGAEGMVVPARAFGGGEIDLPAVDHPRRLVIHEPTDPRWRVRFDGNELPLQTAADRTTAELPAAAGHLEIDLPAPRHAWLALGQLLLLIVVAVLSAPALTGGRQTVAPVGARSATSRNEEER
ncbi:glycosyltransferase family 2 protein [Granulicoccus sp. GXG6511]|uniref:glycosyltransferase family 2 protein n=1 Tax=Granulicoccus sp. GXG6511 TaxID=3381351 RepID=UPI003D7CD3AD